MKVENIRVYIAAPFFNPAQMIMVTEIEIILKNHGIKYFSPRSEGVIKQMTSTEKAVHMKAMYESNLKHMMEANFMIAVIDDYDTGTVFELGYFTRLREVTAYGRKEAPFYDRAIVTITGKDYNLNVMLKFGTDCHLRGVDKLEKLFKEINETESVNFMLEMNDENPEVEE